jgi:hypothetical protein
MLWRHGSVMGYIVALEELCRCYIYASISYLTRRKPGVSS